MKNYIINIFSIFVLTIMMNKCRSVLTIMTIIVFIIYAIVLVVNKKIRNSYEHKRNLLYLFYGMFWLIHLNTYDKNIDYLNLF